MSELTKLENEVLKMLLDGEDRILITLKEQLKNIKVKQRELSSAGFYTTFDMPEYAQAVEGNKTFRIGDVIGEFSTLENGAGFLLYIKDGKLDLLEGYSYEESWPDQIVNFKLSYLGGKRDMEALRKSWL